MAAKDAAAKDAGAKDAGAKDAGAENAGAENAICLWNAIVGNGGQESACGWCADRWGIAWQITPHVLTAAPAAGGEPAKRAFTAMMTLRKIAIAAIEAARCGRGRVGPAADRR